MSDFQELYDVKYVDGLLAEIDDAEEELGRCEERIAYLESQVEKFRQSGWNEQRAVKLRRLETFYNRFSNLITRAGSQPPLVVINDLVKLATTELKYMPEMKWDDLEATPESQT